MKYVVKSAVQKKAFIPVDDLLDMLELRNDYRVTDVRIAISDPMRAETSVEFTFEKCESVERRF